MTFLLPRTEDEFNASIAACEGTIAPFTAKQQACTELIQWHNDAK